MSTKTISFTQHIKRLHDQISEYLDCSDKTEIIEAKLICYFNSGCLSEKLGDYDSALDYYLEGLKLIPSIEEDFDAYLRQEKNRSECLIDKIERYRHIRYFLLNNAGFCFNKLKKCKEGEEYCKLAIKFNPNRANAHKNLGISLEGQGRFVAAARSYINSTMACPKDTRAIMHLENLVKKFPELLNASAFKEDIQKCKSVTENFRNDKLIRIKEK